MVRELGQDGDKMLRELSHAAGVEQVRVVLDDAGEHPVGLGEVHADVEQRVVAGDRVLLDLDPLQGPPVTGRGVLQRDESLHERRTRRIPCRADRVDHAVERDVSVLERVQEAVADSADQRQQVLVLVNCDTGRDRVDEEADHILQADVIAAGGDGSEGDILLPRMAR